MKYETHIILIPVSPSHNGRQIAEQIQNEKFESVSEMKKLIHSKDKDIQPYHVSVYSLCEFMDACNDSDDDATEDEKIDFDRLWLGYVQIKTN